MWPLDWTAGIIVPIHKKGSMLECTNYRGISCECCWKGFCKGTEGSVIDEQGGFRSGRGLYRSGVCSETGGREGD